jgi:hypothetical protein
MDHSILQAALIGYQHQLAQARTAVADIEKQLGGRGPARLRATAEEPESRPRRTMSAAARKRIADAQKKRWAAYKKQKAAA